MDPQNPTQPNLPVQQPPQQPLAPPPQSPVNVAPQAPQPVPPAQPNPLTPNVQTPPHNKSNQLTGQAEKLKKLSIQVMIVGLIGAAAVAVIAVLAGSFNDTFQRALFTLLLVVFHALACLGFIEQTAKSKNSSFKFFENVVFSIIVLSFFTSIFGVWRIIDVSIIGKMYGTYAILLFASLHGQMLVETRGKLPNVDKIVNVNYVFMSLVILLILPLIWIESAQFAGFYYRLLAACGIIDGTLTILAVILYRLYVQKHPEVQSSIFGLDASQNPNSSGQVVARKRHIHPLIWLLGIYIIVQCVISLLFAVSGAFFRR